MSDDVARQQRRNLWLKGFFSTTAKQSEHRGLPESSDGGGNNEAPADAEPSNESRRVVARRALHVLLVDGRWSVFFTHATEPISTHERKREALQVARSIAAREDVDLMIFAAGPEHVPALDDTL